MPNPAAVYCNELGYKYDLVKTAQGEKGICILPDEKCDEWDFFAGKCGKDYSYCVKNGYDIETVSDGKNPYSPEYAVCVPKTPYQKETSVTDFIKLSVDIVFPQIATEEKGTAGITETFPCGGASACPTCPSSFDWRNYNGYNWMTPVKNQGPLGSCAAFAAVGTVEAQIKIEDNTPTINPDLSEQDAFSCHGIEYYLDYFKNTGVVDEACFPYTATSQSCSNKCSDWQSRVQKIYTYESHCSKSDLVENGPLNAAIYMGGQFVNGIYKCGGYHQINHAIVIVGYNDEGSYWIAKNSWGSSWNGDGYFKVGYGECGIFYDWVDSVYVNPPCNCSSWTNDACGADGCTATQRQQTRICTPSGCDVQSRCVDDPLCIPDSCLDTDGGIVPTIKGTVSGYYQQNYYSKTDECTDITYLKEYSCSGTSWSTNTYNCKNYGSNYVCSDGKCTLPTPSTCKSSGGRCMVGSGGCINYCKRQGKDGYCELADPMLGYYPGCSPGNCCCICSSVSSKIQEQGYSRYYLMSVGPFMINVIKTSAFLISFISLGVIALVIISSLIIFKKFQKSNNKRKSGKANKII